MRYATLVFLLPALICSWSCNSGTQGVLTIDMDLQIPQNEAGNAVAPVPQGHVKLHDEDGELEIKLGSIEPLEETATYSAWWSGDNGTSYTFLGTLTVDHSTREGLLHVEAADLPAGAAKDDIVLVTMEATDTPAAPDASMTLATGEYPESGEEHDFTFPNFSAAYLAALGEASGTVSVDVEGTMITVSVSSLPQAPAGFGYEAWIVTYDGHGRVGSLTRNEFSIVSQIWMEHDLENLTIQEAEQEVAHINTLQGTLSETTNVKITLEATLGEDTEISSLIPLQAVRGNATAETETETSSEGGGHGH